MRSAGYDTRTSDRRITATTRQLESMIRLSEAHARMRFSDTVEAQDVTVRLCDTTRLNALIPGTV